MLSSKKAVEQVRILRDYAQAERQELDKIRRYWKGRQPLPTVIPGDAPRVVKAMARMARVNVCPIIVASLTQSVFVDGFRSGPHSRVGRIPVAGASDENDPVWQAWQANKMDARQSSIHRAAFAYGAAYALVLPGEPVPVIKPMSPRRMTAMYGEDPDWPMWALERGDGGLWKLYDDQAIYYVAEESSRVQSDERVYTFVSSERHGAGVTPVVRYLDEDDLDSDDEVDDESGAGYPSGGQIAPMMALQDQIDLTTFGLLVTQWYQAFKQRYVIGWVPKSERQAMKVGASRLMYFEDDGEGPDGVKVGEFSQADLSGPIESRKETLRLAATLSQTPVHELIGELVNLSAEALAAAENGHERKVGERKTLLGESHEQTLRLVGHMMGEDVPDDAQVVWRDTSARTFAATVDGLGKLVTMLDVPAEMLWERIPGVTQQDVERWKAEAAQGGAFADLRAILDRQAA